MSRQPLNGHRQRLSQDDWITIAVCVAIVLASVAIIVRYFDAAFPQASIEFKVDRVFAEVFDFHAMYFERSAGTSVRQRADSVIVV